MLAIFQSIGIATGLPNMPVCRARNESGFAFYFTAVVSLVTGTMFLMWLGEQITERGIGNGISIIIFAGIVAGLPPAIAHTIEQARQGDLHFLLLLLVAVLVFAVTFFVVFVERGQRRIVVNYAKRQQGRRVYAAQSTHLPLKVNMAGVIPAIFASSIILFPATIASWFGGRYRLELADNNFAVFAALGNRFMCYSMRLQSSSSVSSTRRWSSTRVKQQIT